MKQFQLPWNTLVCRIAKSVDYKKQEGSPPSYIYIYITYLSYI